MMVIIKKHDFGHLFVYLLEIFAQEINIKVITYRNVSCNRQIFQNRKTIIGFIHIYYWKFSLNRAGVFIRIIG